MNTPTAEPLAPDAFDVAAYLLQRFSGGLTQMKLQKLLYYCQANSLVWFGQPLFQNEIEAWANGPVVPDVWRALRYKSWVREIEGDPNALSVAQSNCIESVITAYGELTGGDLSNQTHKELPWIKARIDVLPGDHSSNRISIEDMLDFYVKKWKTAQ